MCNEHTLNFSPEFEQGLNTVWTKFEFWADIEHWLNRLWTKYEFHVQSLLVPTFSGSTLEHFHERGEHLVRSQVMSDFGCSLKTSLHLISPSCWFDLSQKADGAWAANELSSMHFCPHSVHDAFAIWVDFQLSAVPPVLLKSTVTIISLLLRCRRRLRRDMKWRETCHPLGPPAAPALPRYPITLLSPVASQDFTTHTRTWLEWDYGGWGPTVDSDRNSVPGIGEMRRRGSESRWSHPSPSLPPELQ